MTQFLHNMKPARTGVIVLGLMLLAVNLSCGRSASNAVEYEPLVETPIADKKSVSGKITLVGEVPSTAGRAIDVLSNPFCSGQRQILDPTWIVSSEGGLSNAVVFVHYDKRASGLPAHAGLIDQRNCEFLPYTKALQVGQSLFFQNSDLTFHNIRVVRHEVGTRDRGVNLDNIAQPARGDLNEKLFDLPGIYRLECDVHRWMKAWIFVHDTAHFAVSDAEGNYEINRELPDGEYQVEAWHPQFPNSLKSTATVKEGIAELNFSFHVTESFEPNQSSIR